MSTPRSLALRMTGYTGKPATTLFTPRSGPIHATVEMYSTTSQCTGSVARSTPHGKSPILIWELMLHARLTCSSATNLTVSEEITPQCVLSEEIPRFYYVEGKMKILLACAYFCLIGMIPTCMAG
ncbi:hypothetical protein BDW42DRAFT_177076 [Aspergillus taichungensis]|uniref:Uncharacterized protein n=1 Tax=Aspergillus taichungensis TaxID=482145 RepID=A0A2J5HJP0_9EURO|nr:hypothetical protein BDW42DRAFT_177076 [Aspergillus taichungensis]